MKRLLLAMALCGALAAQVKLPPYTREVLPNGTVVYLMQRRGHPAGALPGAGEGRRRIGPDRARRTGFGDRRAAAPRARRNTRRRSFPKKSTAWAALSRRCRRTGDQHLGGISEARISIADWRWFPMRCCIRPSRKTKCARWWRGAWTALKIDEGQPGRRPSRPFYADFLLRQRASVWPCAGRSVVSTASGARKSSDSHKRLFVGKNLIVIVAGDFDPAAAKARRRRKLSAPFRPGDPFNFWRRPAVRGQQRFARPADR